LCAAGALPQDAARDRRSPIASSAAPQSTSEEAFVQESPARWPRVSVVMPVRNEARYIARNLEAVLAQDYPADRLEVVVADGRSDDATRDVVRDIIARTTRRAAAGGETGADGPSPVVLVDNPERVMPAGANAAIRRATGELILLLGGHASRHRAYVRECASSA
jgi:cellulose synthase/poly-beta-1,6-N-acetylglucosamine synthase-like glycosyltransferase